MAEKVTDAHNDGGRAGQLRTPSLEHGGERRNHEDHEKGHDHKSHGDDGAGIDHGGFDFFLERHSLFDIGRQAGQDGVQNTAGLPGFHQVAVQGIEDFRVPSQGVGQISSGFDIGFDLRDGLAEGLIVRPPSQDFQALHQRQTGVDHGGKLAGEDDDVALGDFSFFGTEKSALGFFPDAVDLDVLLLQLP